MDVQSREFVVAFAACVEENSTRSFDHMGIDENAVYCIINAHSNLRGLRNHNLSQLTATPSSDVAAGRVDVILY
jgi:hypothetical protein